MLARHKLNKYKDLPAEVVVKSMVNKTYLTKTMVALYLNKLKEG